MPMQCYADLLCKYRQTRKENNNMTKLVEAWPQTVYAPLHIIHVGDDGIDEDCDHADHRSCQHNTANVKYGK